VAVAVRSWGKAWFLLHVWRACRTTVLWFSAGSPELPIIQITILQQWQQQQPMWTTKEANKRRIIRNTPINL